MTKTKQTSKSGNNSTTLQAETININTGLTYSDVKEIVLDLFTSNFLQLSQEASNTALKRVEEITNDFLERIQTDKLAALEFVQDPGFQYVLYEVQKNYAKTGDRDMGNVLIDILLDRIDCKKRDLKQIVLDEAIGVVPKLTSSQLDTLTLIFLLKYSVNNGIKDFETLKMYLEVNIKPFIESLSKENSLYQHLEFAGCGAISIGSNKIENIFKDSYRGLFYKGFSEKEFENQIGRIADFPNFVTSCLNDNTKLQLDIINLNDLDHKIDQSKINSISAEKFKSLFEQYILSDQEIETKLINLGGIFMSNLFDKWRNSAMKSMTLTSVGIAIAQANYRKKTGLFLNLSIWIKEG